MSDALRLIDHPLAATLGWTLTHFMWQGAVLGLIAFFILRVVRPAQASTRYFVGVATLGAMLLAPVVTFLSTANEPASFGAAWQSAEKNYVANAGMVTGSIVADAPANPSLLRALIPSAAFTTPPTDPAPIAPVWLPIVTVIWMLGVSLLSLRMLGGWLLAQSLARRAVVSVSPAIEAAARRLAQRLDVQRHVAVLESAAVSVPTLVGWVRPVVLLPASALVGLSPLQLEAVIAHELAHVRRHDYLVNLLQSVVETLLFYHPAVWWVSADVRAEREHCCDDLAVTVCGDRVVYVSALAELTSIERRAFALGATDGSLVTRVRRILGRPAESRRELPPSWGVLALLVLLGSGAGTYEMTTTAAHMEQFAQEAAATSTATDAPKGVARTDQAVPTPVFAFESIAPIQPLPPAVTAAPIGPTPLAPTPVAPTPLVPTRIVPTPMVQLPLPSGLLPADLVSPASPAAPALGATPVAVAAPPPQPSTPAPPAAPPPAADVQISRSEGSFSWSNDGERLAVKWTGPFRLSDDERDITWIEEGAKVTVADGWVFTDRVELRGLAGGKVERKFFRSGFERDYEAEGRSFLVNAIQRMIRSGMFASDRVARFLKQGGPDAVLAEIDRLPTDSSYLQRVYYSALLKQADLSQQQLARVLERVGKTVTSDYEKATLLVQVLQEPNVGDQQRLEVARATRSIGSDHEQRKVLTVVLAADPLNAAVANAVIEVAPTLGSSHDRSAVLMQLADRDAVTPQTSGAFLAAVTSMSSSYDQRKVLAALAGSGALPEAVVLDSLKAAASISSAHDRRQVLSAYLAQSLSAKVAAAAFSAAGTIGSAHDKAEVLIDVIGKGGVSDDTAPTFFAAVETITSSHDLRRTLAALLARGKQSDAVVGGVIRTAKTISSSHDRAQLLLQVLTTQPLSPANRALFVDAAESISSATDQNSVLAALVRAERR